MYQIALGPRIAKKLPELGQIDKFVKDVSVLLNNDRLLDARLKIQMS